MNKKYKIVIISSSENVWGGSEELWHITALELLRLGHEVVVFKRYLDKSHPKIISLTEKGIKVIDIYQSYSYLNFSKTLKNISKRLARFSFFATIFNSFKGFKNYLYQTWNIYDHLAFSFLWKYLKKYNPDFVLLNQSDNFEGFPYMSFMNSIKLPYSILSQKASEFICPSDEIINDLRKGYQNSCWNFFVSKHNHRLTELQIGIKLNQASIALNPVSFKTDAPLPWPQNKKVKLACIGRMWTLDKGQDLLLEVLALEKWKARNLSVTFIGDGPNLNGLKKMASILEVNHVSFLGHVSDVKSLWEEHHALILPSRAEGKPLVVIEAMMCGRPVIGNSVGGVAEVVEDNHSGFLSSTASIEGIDEAMERAWTNLNKWEEIGENGSDFIRSDYLNNSNFNLAEKLCDIIRKQK